MNRLLRGPGASRRGAFLNYILVYITIGSILMTAAGLCLHSVLKADTADRRAALFLSSLQRVEHQLRDDVRNGDVTFSSPTELIVKADDGIMQRWSADRGILTRTTTESDNLTASDRFVFPAGSAIEMVQGPDQSIVVRITEPSAFVTYSQSGSGGSNLNKPIVEASPPTPSEVAQPKTAEIRLRGVSL